MRFDGTSSRPGVQPFRIVSAAMIAGVVALAAGMLRGSAAVPPPGIVRDSAAPPRPNEPG